MNSMCAVPPPAVSYCLVSVLCRSPLFCLPHSVQYTRQVSCGQTTRAVNRAGYNSPVLVERRNRIITKRQQRHFFGYFAALPLTASCSLSMSCSWYVCRTNRLRSPCALHTYRGQLPVVCRNRSVLQLERQIDTFNSVEPSFFSASGRAFHGARSPAGGGLLAP